MLKSTLETEEEDGELFIYVRSEDKKTGFVEPSIRIWADTNHIYIMKIPYDPLEGCVTIMLENLPNMIKALQMIEELE